MTSCCEHCHSPLPEGTSGVCPACLISLAKIPTGSEASNQFATPSLQELAGRIPGVVLTALIGRGGMGAVYRGHQTDLARDVAVKVLPQTLTDNPVFVERFRREAQALAKLDHPNIVRVFGSGVSDGLCYIVMEYIEGVTLRQAMNAKTVDPESALRIVPQICEALSYAHGQGVVHRDIKPENILLGTGGRVKVVDFGLAKMSDGDVAATMLTATGARLGTLRYMAPEQLDGMDVDHRADVYSLGVVFYEMLTGQIPMGQFAMPSEKVGTDPRIDAVVMRTLSREPADRYQYISEVETELESISQSEGELSWDTDAAAQGSWHGHKSPWGHKSRGHWRPVGREWKSKSTFFGWPIVHIAYGHHPQTRKKLVAKGVIAIGDVAVGGIASGGMSIGIVSLGGFAMGINALGGCAIGLQMAIGGLAIGGVALGGGALGLIALGGGAAGLFALGGGAIGKVAIGGGARGTSVLAGRGWSPPEFIESDWIATLADDRMPWVAALAIGLMWLGPTMLVLFFAVVGMVLSRINGVAEKRMPSAVKRHFVFSITMTMSFFVLLPPLISYYQLHTLQKAISNVLMVHLQTKEQSEMSLLQEKADALRRDAKPKVGDKVKRGVVEEGV